MRMPDADELAAVEAAEERFRSVQERARLDLYRLRLQATVTAVSPLTRDLVDRAGGSLEALAEQLRPTRDRAAGMSHLHGTRDPLIPGAKGRVAPRPGAVRASDQRISRRIWREGVVVPTAAGTLDRFGIVPDKDVLECAGWLGPCWFCTERHVAHVLIDLPETLVAIVPGREIGEIVDHPVLIGRPYRVRRAVALGEAAGFALSFETGLSGHRMPWAEELASEMERGS